MSEHILIQREGPAVRVVLNRPEKRNAFNGQTIDELMAAFTALSEDEETRVIILAAEGKTFCAGADLSWMRELAMSGQSNNDEGARRMAGLFGLIDECRKPVIARVHGATIGGGTGIVAACDIPVASAGAKFGFSEVRLGLAPAVISPYVVARIGTMAARELFVTGERFGADRACSIGLVNYVEEDDAALDARIEQLVGAILQGAPQASVACKDLARTVHTMTLPDAFEKTSALIAQLRSSEEGQEGMMAFLSRRKAAWVPQTPGDDA